jgi:pantetheine-phosphate adenylyltransferase
MRLILMKNIALYPGTFDPITYGHVDLIERACKLFGEVIVAIAASDNKQPLFNLSERIDLAKTALSSYRNAKVVGFDSLLLDFAKEQNARVILRGLRTVTDFDYEFQLACMNRSLNSEIESLFLIPAEKYLYLSSSIIREIAMLGGDVSAYVPANVVTALKQKAKR